MRIAFDRQIFRVQRYGGISRYFAHLTEELLRLGQIVKIFDPGRDNAHLQSLPRSIWSTSYLEQLAGILPYRLSSQLRPQLNILASRQLRKWEPSLLHETYYQKSSLAPKGIPVVLTVYDMIHELFPDQFDASNPTSSNKRAAVERADHIICISESTRSDLIQIFDVDPEKVSVTLLGFDQPEPSTSHTLSNKEDLKPYLLFVGQRDGYKNFERLLEVYISSENLRSRFDLIAFGGFSFTTKEQDILKKAGIPVSQVRRETGDDQALANRYKGASAFIYPSLYEGFGLPPLEAMAQNCPVISSNTSSMPEVIGNAAEFFNPEDSGALELAIHKVVDDTDYSAELVIRGCLRLREFSWRKCATETQSIYQSICR